MYISQTHCRGKKNQSVRMACGSLGNEWGEPHCQSLSSAASCRVSGLCALPDHVTSFNASASRSPFLSHCTPLASNPSSPTLVSTRFPFPFPAELPCSSRPNPYGRRLADHPYLVGQRPKHGRLEKTLLHVAHVAHGPPHRY